MGDQTPITFSDAVKRQVRALTAEGRTSALILGLLPMATGVSFDFRKLAFDIGGESSQWWGPMAVAVIFGLGFATLLTLIVVPGIYFLMRRKAAIRAGTLEAADAPAVPAP